MAVAEVVPVLPELPELPEYDGAAARVHTGAMVAVAVAAVVIVAAVVTDGADEPVTSRQGDDSPHRPAVLHCAAESALA